jgi:hypothetical protein
VVDPLFLLCSFILTRLIWDAFADVNAIFGTLALVDFSASGPLVVYAPFAALVRMTGKLDGFGTGR